VSDLAQRITGHLLQTSPHIKTRKTHTLLQEALDELLTLQSDAERWRYVRDELSQMHSPHMGGEHSYRFRTLRTRGPSIDIAVDKAIQEGKQP
jgi:hypothetical protein